MPSFSNQASTSIYLLWRGAASPMPSRSTARLLPPAFSSCRKVPLAPPMAPPAPVVRDGLDFEPPVVPSGLRSTAPLLPPACSSICLVVPWALAAAIPVMRAAVAKRVVMVFMCVSCLVFENLAASGDALVDRIQDHDTKCVSLVSFPRIVRGSHGLDRAGARTGLVTRKHDQCLARLFVLGAVAAFVLGAVAAARAYGMRPAAVLPERAGASL